MPYFYMLIVIIGIILLIYMLQEAFQNHVLYQTFTFSTFPKEIGSMTFYFISDVHRRKIDKSMIDQMIQTSKPQFVVIGGDLLEKGVPLARIEHNLSLLSKIGPMYFVWGNNDYELQESILKSLFKRHNVYMLRNSSTVLDGTRNSRIMLVGVDDVTTEKEDLEKALEGVTERDFNILVSHNLKIIEQLSSVMQISLVLSGHTHGGQIHIFGFSPYKRGGVKQYDQTTLLISNGYGTTRLPLRLGAKPETHIITIKNHS